MGLGYVGTLYRVYGVRVCGYGVREGDPPLWILYGQVGMWVWGICGIEYVGRGT